MSFPSIMGVSAKDLPQGLSLSHVDGYDYRVENGMWKRIRYHKEKVQVDAYFDSALQDDVEVFAYVPHLEEDFSVDMSFVDRLQFDTSQQESTHTYKTPSLRVRTPRKKGRPRTHFKKYDRKPTAYNKFVQEMLPFVDETLDVNTRMQVVAKMWQDHGKHH